MVPEKGRFQPRVPWLNQPLPTRRLRGLELRLDALFWTTPEGLEQTSPPTPQEPPSFGFKTH